MDLERRERLLLQIAVLLHDCGKYINMAQSSECSYNIIMATEMIGLSHAEREMVANVVRFNSSLILSYEELAAASLLGQRRVPDHCQADSNPAGGKCHWTEAISRRLKDIKVTMKG